MHFLSGLAGAVIIALILVFLNNYVLKYPIPEFMIGYLCCMGQYIGRQIYGEYKK